MKDTLKSSQLVVGLVRAMRGLVADIRVVASLVGRKRKIASYLTSHSPKKLHIGTSNNLLDGWLNSDVFPNNDRVIYLDAARRFPFTDGTFDYIMAEHMIEHIEYPAGQKMLEECFRVLKPGGRVRFATPDLRVLLTLHSTKKTPEQQEYVDWITTHLLPEARACRDVFVINNAFRAWGHQFLYDQETLRYALEQQGFKDITFYKPGISAAPALQNIESHGREIQAEHINQFETTVVEACK